MATPKVKRASPCLSSHLADVDQSEVKSEATYHVLSFFEWKTPYQIGPVEWASTPHLGTLSLAMEAVPQHGPQYLNSSECKIHVNYTMDGQLRRIRKYHTVVSIGRGTLRVCQHTHTQKKKNTQGAKYKKIQNPRLVGLVGTGPGPMGPLGPSGPMGPIGPQRGPKGPWEKKPFNNFIFCQ